MQNGRTTPNGEAMSNTDPLLAADLCRGAADSECSSMLAKESRYLWRALRDVHAARRAGSLDRADEALDDVEAVFINTDYASLRRRAGVVLAELRPSAVLDYAHRL